LVGEALATGGGRRLVRVLAGERTWNGLSSSVIAMLEANAALIERDARAFLAFEPSLPPRGSTVSLICTVGEHSRPLRLAVARRLSELTGSAVELIPGCGHLPQFDAPQAFAQMILNHARTGDLQRSSKCH
jgi:pimeloyl-ACP methyl ester carboxylesterase